MKTLPFALSFVAASSFAFGEATKPGTHYVVEGTLEVRLAPSSKAAVTNRIHRNQKVDVYEVKRGWARVSEFYNGSVEGTKGKIARWVSAKGLSSTKPADLAQPAMSEDPRIAKDAFPKVGEDGLTEQDVRILYKGAIKFLNEGKATRIEYGNKSTSKPNTYFINIGGKNVFFTPADVE